MHKGNESLQLSRRESVIMAQEEKNVCSYRWKMSLRTKEQKTCSKKINKTKSVITNKESPEL